MADNRNEGNRGEVKADNSMAGNDPGRQSGTGDGLRNVEDNRPDGNYRDPHGNQSGREPEGGSGAGQSRGDESSYNPGETAADNTGTRSPDS